MKKIIKYFKNIYKNMTEYYIKNICRKHHIHDYTINDDGSIDVENVEFNPNYYHIKRIPLKFNKVNNNFMFICNDVRSLKGSPKYVNGHFRCGGNKLKSLKYSPEYVGELFCCESNNLRTLKYAPKEVNDFNCFGNKLTSFRYSPEHINGNFICSNNNIKNFEYFPKSVNGYFYCYGNPIYEVWKLFEDTTKIDLLNDCDIFRNEDTNKPGIFIDRLNDFLEIIGKPTVKEVYGYKSL